MTAVDTLAIDEAPETKADFAIALGHLCHRAKREFPTVDVPSRPPSAWDKRHEAINERLTEWERAQV